MATFGNRYKKLIDSNPNQKSIPNNNPGIVYGLDRTKNPYINLISSGSAQKSLFNTNPGIEFGVYKTKNPYVNLINKWNFTQVAPEAPFIGRDVITPVVDLYYVEDFYVAGGFVEVQQIPAW